MPKTTDGKAAKKVKDPNKPKGKLSAFMYFSADQRITLKTEQPGKAAVWCKHLAHAVAGGAVWVASWKRGRVGGRVPWPCPNVRPGTIGRRSGRVGVAGCRAF